MQKIHNLIEKLCPNGVKYKNIQELCKISRGKVMSKDFIKSNAGEYPVYSSQTENNGELGKISTYDFDGEYLTWTTDGANAGSVFYRKGKFSVTNVCGLLEIKSKIMIPKFLYYVLSIEAPKYVNAGMGNPKLMSNVMAKIRVAVPPLEVQCEIVHILDDFTLLSAELSAELKARQKQYEYYASKLFTSFKAKDYPMGKLAKFVYGYTDKAIDNGNTRFIRITDINDQGYLKKDDIKYINMNEKAQKSLLKKGDLVMARTGATFGKTLYFDDDVPSVYASFLIKIIPDNTKLLNKYYWHFTKTQLYWSQANKLVTNGGQPQFNTPALKKIRIPIPTIDEQHKVVDILDRLDKICNDISEGLPAEIEARKKQYEYYRDKLLTFKELKVNE